MGLLTAQQLLSLGQVTQERERQNLHKKQTQDESPSIHLKFFVVDGDFERRRNIDVKAEYRLAASRMPPTAVLDLELNQPFIAWNCTHPTEPQ